MIIDETRMGSVFSAPPACQEEANQRLQLMANEPEEVEQIRRAATIPPVNLEEARARIHLVGLNPASLMDFKFNSADEFVTALREFDRWITKVKILPGIDKNASRRIVLVTIENNDHEIRFILTEQDRPQIANVFYVRVVRSVDKDWKRACDEALK
jgi:hypothetical protein